MANVELTVTGDSSQAQDAINRFTSCMQNCSSNMTQFKNTWLGIKALELAQDLVVWAKEALMLSARYETLGVTMRVVGNNAGYTGAQMAEFQGALQKTGIAMVEARQSLTQMAQAHIDLSKSAQLARMAQDAAVIGGINSSEAFSRMVYGIQSGQTEVLRTIGINVNFEESYRKLAKQLGKSTEDLTEYEKVTARTNITLEKGKDINGAYEAAMGTAGKQILSMKRYLDDLKVVLGQTFSEALLIGVTTVTGGLKDMKDEAGQLQQKGDLQSFGRQVITAMAFAADGVQGLYVVLRGLTETAIWSAKELWGFVNVAESVAKLDFSGASGWFNWMGMQSDNYNKSMGKLVDGIKSFQSETDSYFKKIDTAAAGDKAIATNAEQRRILNGKIATEELHNKEAAELAEKKYLENLKLSIGAVKEYATALADLGKERLKNSEERFTDQLKQTVELYKQNKAGVAELTAVLNTYHKESEKVFMERLAVEQDGLGKLGAMYEEFKRKVVNNANVKEVKAQGVEILKAYKEMAEKIIGVEQSRYQTLIEGERKYAAEVLGLINIKKQEAKDLQTYFEDLDKKRADRKIAAIDPSLDAYDKYMATLSRVQTAEADAWKLVDSGKRSEALKKVISSYDEMTDSVVVGNDTIISKEAVVQQSEENIQRIRSEMTNKITTDQKVLEDAYAASMIKMEAYKGKLLELDDILKNMTRTITIDLKVNGMQAIQQINGYMTTATADPNIPAATVDPPGLAVGTPYVNSDGLAYLHQGEAVLTAAQNANLKKSIEWLSGPSGIMSDIHDLTDPNKVVQSISGKVYQAGDGSWWAQTPGGSQELTFQNGSFSTKSGYSQVGGTSLMRTTPTASTPTTSNNSASNGNSGVTVYVSGGITVNAGTTSDPKQLARALYGELQQLGTRYRQ